MAHPPFWQSTFFYPIGNTSPVCLTGHLPPGEHASVLLLGTGDLRNILYTTYVDRATRTLDFTSCDIEPAILARNVLLLSLLFDGKGEDSAMSLWNFYHHFLVDDSTLSIIISQCSRLAELSTDLETWNTCRYAGFIRFCDRHTLGELHRMWIRYAETAKWSNSERHSFKEKFLKEMHKIGARRKTVTTSMRSAGPLASHAWKVSGTAYSDFWKTGVTMADAAYPATNVNPTFAFAAHGEGCVSHYGTCPLSAFHLAPAFIQARENVTKPTVADAYAVARSQFRAWCEAFTTSLKKHKVTLRLVLGDALAVCHTISHIATTGEITARHAVMQWQTSPLAFDGGDYADHRIAPVTFDVIDTSNLSDHLGILNVLIVTTALLRPSPASVLQTETLLPFGKDPTMSFAERICGDIRTMALLLDLAPVSFISGFTSQSNVHELMWRSDPTTHSQYHERIIWKKPSLLGFSDGRRARLSLDATQAANLLLAAYRKMFTHESPVTMLQGMHIHKLRNLSAVHYSRLSFAFLVGCVKQNVVCDWETTAQRVLSLVREDLNIMLGNCYYQDLLSQLHVMGLCIDDDLNSLLPVTQGGSSGGIFRAWPSIPPLVSVVFTVPREKYKVLDDADFVGLGTPNLKVEIVTGPSLNSFCSVRLAFGSVSCHGLGKARRVTVTEDPLGKRGDSDVVVVFLAPSFLLTFSPENTQVSLCVQVTPMNSGPYMKKLGPMLTIHSENLMKRGAVYIVDITYSDPQSPFDFASTPLAFSVASESRPDVPPTSEAQPIRAELNGNNDSIVMLVNREELTEEAKLELAKQTTEVTYTQTHACVIQVSIGPRVVHNRRFPYPVVGSEIKLRIARKSGWVEIIAPLAGDGDLVFNRYPLGGIAGAFAPWNIHRVVLERLPVVVASANLSWVGGHLPLMLSDVEMDTFKHRPNSLKVLTQVKQSILALFQDATGTGSKGRKICIFGLHKTSGGGVGTVIFVNDVRLDLSSHTLVADGHVLPLTDGNVRILGPHLARLENLASIACSDEEITEWAHLIPAFVERCRDWKHKNDSDCAYKRRGVVPLSDQFGGAPICNCGQGKVSPAFRARKEWAAFIPWVTRIAISPIFAVSYLEPVGQELGKMVRSSTAEARTDPPAQPRCFHCKRNIPKDTSIMRCSRCKEATYCDGTCQKADWKKHKIICTTG